jgi:hypothetical protein
MKKIVLLGFTLTSFLFSNVGIVKNITGEVDIKRGKEVIPIKAGFTLKKGDIIMTKSKSSIGIIFDDGTVLALDEKAVFVINSFKVKPETKEFNVDLFLQKGKAVFTSGKVGKLKPESVKFRIPEGIIGIRGTKFAVEVK